MLNTLMKLAPKVAARIFWAMMTQEMLIWILRNAAKRTDTLVDDYAVDVLEGGLKNDPAKIRKGARSLVEALGSRVVD